jgi:hypothetical protein
VRPEHDDRPHCADPSSGTGRSHSHLVRNSHRARLGTANSGSAGRVVATDVSGQSPLELIRTSGHDRRCRPLHDHGHRCRFRVLLGVRDHTTRFVAVHATVRDHGYIGRRCESGCHADIPRESRRRQLAPAAAHARHTDGSGCGFRSHRDGSAADRRRVSGMGSRHGCRRRQHMDRYKRALLAMRLARNPSGFTIRIQDRIFARWLVTGLSKRVRTPCLISS